MQNLTELSAKKLVELIKTKKVSCVEVMQAHLDKTAEVNPKINAVIQELPHEQALEQARAADAAIANNKPLGELHGLPITFKDGYKVIGFFCSLGIKNAINSVSTEDSTVAARLKAAGAIITGITNVPAFLISNETDNSLYGRSNNPYDLSRTPAGSSGGQASIIGAGCSPLGIGTDAGGSLRIPAHVCGITTLKPTSFLIPSTGIFPKNGSGIITPLATFGPMARYIEDLILTLPIIAGPDEHDSNAAPVILRDPAKVDLKSLRIAFHTDNGVHEVCNETIETVQNAVRALSNDVARVREDCPTPIKEVYNFIAELYFWGGDRGQWLLNLMNIIQAAEPDPLLQKFIKNAQQSEFSVTELRRRLLEVDTYKYAMMDFMKNYDVIICPVSLSPAKKHGTVDTFKEVCYCFPYNVTGWPAAIVRCGTSKENLPIGVQIIAKSWREDIVLAVAKRLEEIFGGWKMP